jgi:hypothetical protein
VTSLLDTPVAPPTPETPEVSEQARDSAAARGAADESSRPPADPTRVALAAGLSAAATAWMVGGLFRPFSAHFVALIGVAVGTGMAVLAQRGRGRAVLQWLTTPVALLVGVLLMTPDLSGRGATLTRLVSDAVHSGGLLQPPVAFLPGWKVILVVLLALVGTGAASIAIATQRPRLGVALPMPLTMGAAIIQPGSAQLTSAAVAIALVVAALSVAYGAELGREGQLGSAFEMRRLLRTTAVAGALFVAVAGIDSMGFLFPQPNRDRVIPPQRPPVSAPVSDRVLFSYTATAPQPLRLGVIDVYDQSSGAWLLPAYDAARLQRLDPPVTIPAAQSNAGPETSVRVSMGDWDGQALPSIAGLTRIDGIDNTVSYDPRTGALSLADQSVTPGMRYTLVGAPTPAARQLATAGTPTGMQQYLSAPSPPNEVVVVLHNCRSATQQSRTGNDAFDLMQCARQRLFSSVAASGAGVPTDVSPGRVAQMLRGGDASPYEITAAEALIARWAGVPSRIGYGYYGGDQQSDGSYQIHPHHAATWLEAYFNGAGWVPILGQPPRAHASTSMADKNKVPAIALDHLQLILYIPYQRPSLHLLYETVQYIVVRLVPTLLLVVLAIAGYPWLVKRMRTRKRRRWALELGLSERIAVAYTEMRDRARDLGIGDAARSPLAFLDCVAADVEHEELAWLVSRALWGDLRRDLRPHDAVAAERWSRSVATRLDRAQPMVNRVLSRISRASLREPYSNEVPNLWWRVHPRDRLRALLDVDALRRGLRWRRRLAFGAGVSAITLLLSSCASAPPPARTMPHGLVPAAVGPIAFSRQAAAEARYRVAGNDALVSEGRVYTVVVDGVTYGAVQVELFKPRVTIDDINDESQTAACTDNPDDCPGHEVFKGIQAQFQGHFHRIYHGGERVYELVLSDQRVYLWFPPHTETMVLLVLLHGFGPASSDALMHALVDVEHHRTPATIPPPPPLTGASV